MNGVTVFTYLERGDYQYYLNGVPLAYLVSACPPSYKGKDAWHIYLAHCSQGAGFDKDISCNRSEEAPAGRDWAGAKL